MFMLAVKNKHATSGLQVPPPQRISNRKILLGQYLNKSEDRTQSHVSTCIVEQDSMIFQGLSRLRILRQFY